eukprot:scpid92991/ scgid10740/ 
MLLEQFEKEYEDDEKTVSMDLILNMLDEEQKHPDYQAASPKSKPRSKGTKSCKKGRRQKKQGLDKKVSFKENKQGEVLSTRICIEEFLNYNGEFDVGNPDHVSVDHILKVF